MPIVCLHPSVNLREGANLARNAQWALVQYHPWEAREESWMGMDNKGDPQQPKLVEDFFRDWVDSARCPWYIQEQYYDDNNLTFRHVLTDSDHKLTNTLTTTEELKHYGYTSSSKTQ